MANSLVTAATGLHLDFGKVEELLAEGADVNDTDENGNTALHVAAREGNAALIQLLVSNGADQGVKNAEGKTPKELVEVVPKTVDRKALHEAFTKVQGTKIKVVRSEVPRGPLPTLDVEQKLTSILKSPELSATVRFYWRGGISWASKVLLSNLLCGDSTLLNLEARFKKLLVIALKDSPPDDARIWKWIHFPANNMTWVKDLLLQLYPEMTRRETIWEFFQKSVGDSATGDTVSNVTRKPRDHRAPEIVTEAENDRISRMSIVIPYIDFEEEEYLLACQEKIDIPQRFEIMQRLETKYDRYKGLDGLQAAQSLDGSYFKFLSSECLIGARGRDEDQVMYKWFKDEKSRAGDGPPLKARLIMIRQLWLWKVDEENLITCLPDRWHTDGEDALLGWFGESTLGRPKTPDELTELLLVGTTALIPGFEVAGRNFSVLDIFEDSLTKQTETERKRFDGFKRAVARKAAQTTETVHPARELLENLIHPLAWRAKITAAREQENRDRKQSRLIHEEIEANYEIKDVREELHILSRIFACQKAVLEKAARSLWPDDKEPGDKEPRRNQFLQQCGIDELIAQTEKLDGDAERTVERLDYLVSMKQAQGSLDEAEWASEEAKKSQRLNNYIMLFTIVTIIFTPLSFMTSLFAVPIQQWPHDDSGSVKFDSAWIAGRMTAGELTTLAVVCVIFLIMLWSEQRHYPAKRRPPPPPNRPPSSRHSDSDDSKSNPTSPFSPGMQSLVSSPGIVQPERQVRVSEIV